MTTPLIEAMTRAMPRDIDYLWRKACAQAALTAITEAGYAVVPVEPTLEMIRAVDGEDSDVYVARGRAISAWELMISAAQAGEPAR